MKKYHLLLHCVWAENMNFKSKVHNKQIKESKNPLHGTWALSAYLVKDPNTWWLKSEVLIWAKYLPWLIPWINFLGPITLLDFVFQNQKIINFLGAVLWILMKFSISENLTPNRGLTCLIISELKSHSFKQVQVGACEWFLPLQFLFLQKLSENLPCDRLGGIAKLLNLLLLKMEEEWEKLQMRVLQVRVRNFCWLGFWWARIFCLGTWLTEQEEMRWPVGTNLDRLQLNDL